MRGAETSLVAGRRPVKPKEIGSAAGIRVGLGCVVRKDASDGVEAMLSCLALVICRLLPTAQVRRLTRANEHALMIWDAERYRQQLTASR